jgi:endonuclease YncB( thermonuclease family)
VNTLFLSTLCVGLLLTQTACGKTQTAVSSPQQCGNKPAQIQDYAKHNLKQYQGKVLRISDGDTLQIRDNHGQKQRVRLAFIDAPETEQAGGRDSQRQLQRLLDNKSVLVQVVDIDNYKRQVAIVWLQKQDINATQIATGMAWQYASIAKRQQTAQGYQYYHCLEQSARSSKEGLWRNGKAQAPWEYRQQRRQQQ